MKRSASTNEFSKGLIMDLHPSVTPNSVLTDALNATLITNNGNENVLQNDMGNGRVDTAFLPEGYIPVGSCELGGIIYVASYNPLINKCQLGCFPSPQRYITSDQITDLQQSISNSEFQGKNGKLKQTTLRKIIFSQNLQAGDKYIISYSEDVFGNISDYNNTSHQFGTFPKFCKVTVVSIEEDGKMTELTSGLKWYNGANNSDFFLSSYKFNNEEHKKDIDSKRTLVSSAYSIFSSKVSGKLGLLFELEKIKGFSCTWKASVGDIEYSTIGTLTDIISTPYKIDLSINWDTDDFCINPEGVILLDQSGNVLKTVTVDKLINVDAENPVIESVTIGTMSPGLEVWSENNSNNYWSEAFKLSYDIGNYSFTEHKTKVKELQEYVNPLLNEGKIRRIENGKYVFGNVKIKNNGDYINENNTTVKQYEIKDDLVNNFWKYPILIPFGTFNIPTHQIYIPTNRSIELQTIPTPLLYTFTVAPYMKYGILEEYAITNTINFSNLGKKSINLNTWKYYNQEGYLTLTWGLEAYTEPNKDISRVVIEFYNNEGFQAALYSENKDSYNGVFTNYFTFDSTSNLSNTSYTNTKGSGEITSNSLYLAKIYIDYCDISATGEYYNPQPITFYRWLWTTPQFNDLYFTLQDFNNAQFSLDFSPALKFETTSEFNENWKVDTKGNKNPNQFSKAITIYPGQCPESLSYTKQEQIGSENGNVTATPSVSLLNDYQIFKLNDDFIKNSLDLRVYLAEEKVMNYPESPEVLFSGQSVPVFDGIMPQNTIEADENSIYQLNGNQGINISNNYLALEESNKSNSLHIRFTKKDAAVLMSNGEDIKKYIVNDNGNVIIDKLEIGETYSIYQYKGNNNYIICNTNNNIINYSEVTDTISETNISEIVSLQNPSSDIQVEINKNVDNNYIISGSVQNIIEVNDEKKTEISIKCNIPTKDIIVNCPNIININDDKTFSADITIINNAILTKEVNIQFILTYEGKSQELLYKIQSNYNNLILDASNKSITFETPTVNDKLEYQVKITSIPQKLDSFTVTSSINGIILKTFVYDILRENNLDKLTKTIEFTVKEQDISDLYNSYQLEFAKDFNKNRADLTYYPSSEEKEMKNISYMSVTNNIPVKLNFIAQHYSKYYYNTQAVNYNAQILKSFISSKDDCINYNLNPEGSHGFTKVLGIGATNRSNGRVWNEFYIINNYSANKTTVNSASVTAQAATSGGSKDADVDIYNGFKNMEYSQTDQPATSDFVSEFPFIFPYCFVHSGRGSAHLNPSKYHNGNATPDYMPNTQILSKMYLSDGTNGNERQFNTYKSGGLGCMTKDGEIVLQDHNKSGVDILFPNALKSKYTTPELYGNLLYSFLTRCFFVPSETFATQSYKVATWVYLDQNFSEYTRDIVLEVCPKALRNNKTDKIYTDRSYYNLGAITINGLNFKDYVKSIIESTSAPQFIENSPQINLQLTTAQTTFPIAFRINYIQPSMEESSSNPPVVQCVDELKSQVLNAIESRTYSRNTIYAFDGEDIVNLNTDVIFKSDKFEGTTQEDSICTFKPTSDFISRLIIQKNNMNLSQSLPGTGTYRVMLTDTNTKTNNLKGFNKGVKLFESFEDLSTEIIKLSTTSGFIYNGANKSEKGSYWRGECVTESKKTMSIIFYCGYYPASTDSNMFLSANENSFIIEPGTIDYGFKVIDEEYYIKELTLKYNLSKGKAYIGSDRNLYTATEIKESGNNPLNINFKESDGIAEFYIFKQQANTEVKIDSITITLKKKKTL